MMKIGSPSTKSHELPTVKNTPTRSSPFHPKSHFIVIFIIQYDKTPHGGRVSPICPSVPWNAFASTRRRPSSSSVVDFDTADLVHRISTTAGADTRAHRTGPNARRTIHPLGASDWIKSTARDGGASLANRL